MYYLDDDFDNAHESDPLRPSSDQNLFGDQGGIKKGLDPFNFLGLKALEIFYMCVKY